MTPEHIKKMQEGRIRAKENGTIETKPSMKQAIRAKCAECTCFHADGKEDCGIPLCPLYYWMPYKDGNPLLWWVKLATRDLQLAYKRARRAWDESNV